MLWSLTPKTSDSTLNHNMKYYILNGILFTVMMNLFFPFTAKFLTRLGGSDFHISLLNALPGLVAVFATIPGIIFINRTHNKKKMVSQFFFASRLFILLFATIPFFPRSIQPILFVILIALRQFPESVSQSAFQSFTGDIFSDKKRATAISSRNRLSVVAQLLTVLTVFFIFRGPELDDNTAKLIYQSFFVISFILGIIEIYTFTKLKEKNNDTVVECNEVAYENENILDNNSLSKSLLETTDILKRAFRNKNFMSFIACSLIYHFGWQMGWPLFATYQINYLGATEGWIAILSVISSIVMFFGYKFWNKVIDRKGNPPIMAITTLGMSLTPLLFAISPNLYVLSVATIVTGIFTSGTVTVLLNSLLEVSPEKNRILFVGLHVTLTSITLSISPIVGNAIHNSFNIYAALCIASLFRFLGSMAFFIRNKYLKSIK